MPGAIRRRRCLQAVALGAALGLARPMALANGQSATAPRRRPRRPPEPPIQAVDQLPDAVHALWRAAGLPDECLGLHVQPVRPQEAPLASLHAEQVFTLASTAKVVTTLAALNLLGPSFRWRTPAFLVGPLEQGALHGDLRILGVGDARLRAEDLLDWFLQMQLDGLREIRGNIVLDGFAFRLSEADLAGTPAPSLDRPHHAWPSAFTVDEGRLRLRVDSAADGRPRVALLAPVSGLVVQSRLTVKPGDCRVSANLSPAGQGLARRLMVEGRWAPECGQRELALSAWPQQESTERLVEALWRQAGGRLRGKVLTESRPPANGGGWPVDREGRALQAWSMHRSAPLPVAVRDINKTSDNLAARNLMLTMAPDFPFKPATLPGACERVQRWLRQQGLAAGDIAVQSGSGLSRAERGRPRALVQLLRQAWRTPLRESFMASLPVAGIDGTLANRLTGSVATGRAFLKTGTLLDARALAGYVMARSGRPYAMAALVNHPEAQRANPALDRIIEWIVMRG